MGKCVVVALVAGLVSTSGATVIDSGPVNLPLVRDFTGNGLNLVTGETSRNPNDRDADIIIFELSGEWRFANLDSFVGGGIVVDEPGSLNAVLLRPGDVVGPGLPLRPGGGIRTLGIFDDVEDAYIGVLFENEATSTLHYGWVEVFLPSVGNGEITRYAYESEPLTALTIPGGCAADLAAPKGELTFADVQAYLTAFAAQDDVADFAPPFATLSFADVQAFLRAFAAGCP